METRVKIAHLDQPGLSKLKALEAELGTIIVAYEKEHAMADLTNEQLARLQALEKELGVVLEAFQPA